MTTLLDKIKEHGDESGDRYYRHRLDLIIPADKEGEVARAFSYLDLASLKGREVFQLYEKEEDISACFLDEYADLLEKFRGIKYVKKSGPGVFERLREKTSSWFCSEWVDYEIDPLLKFLFSAGVLVSSGVAGHYAGNYAGSSTGYDVAGIVGGAAAGITGLAGFMSPIKTKTPKVLGLKKKSLKDTLLETHRLHYLAQIVYQEAREIEYPEDGSRKSSNDYLRDLETIETAKEEVQKVISYTRTILKAAGMELPVLEPEYQAGKGQIDWRVMETADKARVTRKKEEIKTI
ncbi:hypothetical protein J4437_01620 [Candidatus Woesearchaeota archaeon]|nr:hypothetical protein [Candidatus Woesearchaeota archaeon]